MDRVIELHSDEAVTIRGRGRVYLIRDYPEGVGDPKELLGCDVTINGYRYAVVGVERPFRPGGPFGVLVRRHDA